MWPVSTLFFHFSCRYYIVSITQWKTMLPLLVYTFTIDFILSRAWEIWEWEWWWEEVSAAATSTMPWGIIISPIDIPWREGAYLPLLTKLHGQIIIASKSSCSRILPSFYDTHLHPLTSCLIHSFYIFSIQIGREDRQKHEFGRRHVDQWPWWWWWWYGHEQQPVVFVGRQ